MTVQEVDLDPDLHDRYQQVGRSHDGVGGGGGDAAQVVPVPRHLDVAVDAPLGAPGVLDEPVVAAVLGAVADDQATRGQVSVGAGLIIIHATRVQLERGLRLVDGHGDGTDVGDGVLQGALAAGGDVHVAGEGGHVLSMFGLAAVIVAGGVGVVGLRLDTVINDVAVNMAYIGVTV